MGLFSTKAAATHCATWSTYGCILTIGIQCARCSMHCLLFVQEFQMSLPVLGLGSTRDNFGPICKTCHSFYLYSSSTSASWSMIYSLAFFIVLLGIEELIRTCFGPFFNLFAHLLHSTNDLLSAVQTSELPL